MQHILWAPEGGICSCCHRPSNQVRRFTSAGTHTILCFACWDGVQESHLVSSFDWKDNEILNFECNSENGTAPRLRWN